MMPGEMNTELSKVLSKVMQSSYKRKEAGEVMERIMSKVDKLVMGKYDESEIRSLRLEFEEIRKGFYEL